mgnify:CR=1 FL=1
MLSIKTMAKPIRATPTLRGEDARRFVQEVIEEQRKPSKARVKLLRDAMLVKFNFPQ